MPPPALPARLAHLRMRDFLLLEHLGEVASLSEAAARLHVTQSAVTQALHALEGAFGATLVVRGQRGQRGIRLTAAGEAALLHLRVARQELIAAQSAAGEPGTLDLRVGALPLALVQPLPAALARLRKRLPQVHVQLVEDTVPSLWRRMEAGELDAMVSRLPALSERQRLPSGVAHRIVGRESLVLVCGRGHPLAGRRQVRLAQLLAYDWVLPPEGSYTRLAIDQKFLRAGLRGPRAAVTSMSFHTNLRLVAGSELLAVAPRAPAVAMRAALGLTLFPMDWLHEDTALVLVWREASLANPALGALLECFP